jgi:hypothetical protein
MGKSFPGNRGSSLQNQPFESICPRHLPKRLRSLAPSTALGSAMKPQILRPPSNIQSDRKTAELPLARGIPGAARERSGTIAISRTTGWECCAHRPPPFSMAISPRVPLCCTRGLCIASCAKVPGFFLACSPWVRTCLKSTVRRAAGTVDCVVACCRFPSRSPLLRGKLGKWQPPAQPMPSVRRPSTGSGLHYK